MTRKTTATGIQIADNNIKINIRKVTNGKWSSTTRYLTKSMTYTTAYFSTMQDAIASAEGKLANYHNSAIWQNAAERI